MADIIKVAGINSGSITATGGQADQQSLEGANGGNGSVQGPDQILK